MGGAGLYVGCRHQACDSGHSTTQHKPAVEKPSPRNDPEAGSLRHAQKTHSLLQCGISKNTEN